MESAVTPKATPKEKTFPELMEGLGKAMHSTPLEDVAEVVGKGRLKGHKSTELIQAMHVANITPDMLHEAYIRAGAGLKGGKESVPLFQAGRKWPKWVGGAGGLAAGSLLTGLPMAIRATALRRTGGEFAAQARNRMRKTVEKAEREQFRRENILQALDGEMPLPKTEWKAQKSQLRDDWKSSLREYRELAKARRQGQRQLHSSVPEAKEASLEMVRQATGQLPTEWWSAVMAHSPSMLARGAVISRPGRALGLPRVAAPITSGLESAERAATGAISKAIKPDSIRNLMALLRRRR